MSPLQRSKRLLEERGYTVAITEHWNPFARIRQDLFGAFDLLGIDTDGTTTAVQTTSASNLAARVRKLAALEVVALARQARWQVVVHGWAKRNGRWQCREVIL